MSWWSRLTGGKPDRELKPQRLDYLSGAHYGLAFLLLKRGETAAAAEHLETFLATPPASGETERWVRHARETLAQIRGEHGTAGEPAPDDARSDVPPDYAR